MNRYKRSTIFLFAVSAFFAAAAAECSSQARRVSTPPADARASRLDSPAIERRVDQLLKKMTLAEKLGQLVQYTSAGSSAVVDPTTAAANLAANPQVKYHVDVMQLATEGKVGSVLGTAGVAQTNQFQHAAVEKSRLHIPLLFGFDVIHGYRTIYPIPLGVAATFDPGSATSLAHMAGSEASSAGVRWVYAPMVDISRDARWGRTAEGAGEDPYLGAAMARSYVIGYQGEDLSRPDSVAASVKHFAAYGGAEAGREYYTTDMSLSRLHQIYLPPYKAAVEAGSATVMSAFNPMNGTPAAANSYLLTDILRSRWGFKGAVVSDYTAVMELINHGVALDSAEAARKALVAGTDVDMMSHLYDTELPRLVASGKVPESVVDLAVRRVLRVKFALGLFEHPYVDEKEVTSPSDEYRVVVRKAAEESFVLLKNKTANGASVLPLPNTAQTVALIGPLADNPGEMLGAWSGSGRASDTVTLRTALKEHMKSAGGTLLYSKGTDISGTSTSGFAEALDAANRADVVIAALGESRSMSGEASSRANLDLPGNQESLLRQIVAIGKPVILLVFSGRPLALQWESSNVDAIMAVWFPGTEAGNALVNVIYGNTAPSGKLPMSFPYNVGQEPLYYNQFPTGRPASENPNVVPRQKLKFVSGYIDVPNAPLFPFGFGLTYTTFQYSDVKLSRSALPISEALPGKKNLAIATATVTNSGSRTATEVAQCYVRNLGTSLEQPMRSLKGFTRVTLAPGESRVVTFPLGFDELAFFDNSGKARVEASKYTVWIGGSSLASDHADFSISADSKK
jgi:beta-glucosidase